MHRVCVGDTAGDSGLCSCVRVVFRALTSSMFLIFSEDLLYISKSILK